MTKDIVNEIKVQLIAEKERITKELSKFAHRRTSNSEDYQTDYPSFGDDEDENAMEVAEYSNNLSLEQALEKALRDIDKALKRIDEGIYDVCKYCGAKIEPERLKARPTSSSCIACKKTLTQEM
ncbi:TraR/DksA family transcriptional regulator [Patescibacteria group bacterium]|nr:TraR/DksA family transcriptional regulator [Patescibacteria group bacterium]